MVDRLDVEASIIDDVVARSYHGGYRSFSSALKIERRDRADATAADQEDPGFRSHVCLDLCVLKVDCVAANLSFLDTR